MVNAQEYINQNFPKHVQEIVAINKNLEGDLDLSDYPNLTNVDIGNNSQLRSLKLASSTRITWMSLYNTGINNLSFLAELPNIQTISLPRIGEHDYAYFAQVIREICQEKNRELEKLSQENQQFRVFTQLLFPNRPYNLLEFQLEIARLKYQELAPQVRNKKIELEQLVTNAKNKEVSFATIIDLFLGTQKQIVEQGNNSDFVQGQLIAYQNVLQTKLTQEELQTLLNKQTELCQLENHLANLQLRIS
ncbi:hypothetical protein RclHR1_07710011 [Rhizophagus clarus]|uniref:Uncharacterized protein n=1 Tax=Rhizophagus clarus TaxID=94130 RepID=A0A2Z6SLL5_9GLOM|nr:hypothetical protein RclHR1_07710011 [Rhizophagus clarus]GES95668.1 hypothetical protein GLOIN_2v1474482 [Rhizophagus clarus]